MDGRELVEHKNEEGKTVVTHTYIGGYGFVPSVVADLQVGEIMPGLIMGRWRGYRYMLSGGCKQSCISLAQQQTCLQFASNSERKICKTLPESSKQYCNFNI